jgi:hypothetical protein
MKGKLAAGVYFLLLIAVLFVSGLWSPSLELPDFVDRQQAFAIRTLSSFCYYGVPRAFWELTLISNILICVFSIFVLISGLSEYKSFIKSLLLFHVLTHYFFWLFSTNPNNPAESPRYAIAENFNLMTFYFFLIQGVFYMLFWMLFNCFSQVKTEKTRSIVQPALVTTCRHCGAQYHSSVQYCIKCNKNIQEE